MNIHTDKTRKKEGQAAANSLPAQRSINESSSKPLNSECMQKKENTTGLSNDLKTGVDNFSQFSMENVNVNYNSEKSSQIQTEAYTKSPMIHASTGKESHLPRENWTAVQKKGGPIKSTGQLKTKANIKDEAMIEREADLIGFKPLQMNSPVQHLGFQGNYSTIVQLTRDADEMQGIQGFQYDNIISWNGNPGVHQGVNFIVNPNTQFMEAVINPPTVYYNPVNVQHMTPQARYFMIMHELSHIHHQHPGSNHPESLLNETQADDTALVNAMTHFPVQAQESVLHISNFFDWMITQNMLGGNTHPLTATRKLRIQQLYEMIMDQSTINVQIRSQFTPTEQMTQFLQANALVLLIDPHDIRSFNASNGSFSYIQGNGTITLRRFIQWYPDFQQRQGLLPGFHFTHTWNVRPVTVQRQQKENIAGAVPQI